MRTVVTDAIWACYRRSLEMGDLDSNIGPGRFNTMSNLPINEFPDFVENMKGGHSDAVSAAREAAKGAEGGAGDKMA
jgi:hypothetical protein